jgi:hypothetical protein
VLPLLAKERDQLNGLLRRVDDFRDGAGGRNPASPEPSRSLPHSSPRLSGTQVGLQMVKLPSGEMRLCIKRPGTWSAVATLLRQQLLEYACVALTPGELMRDGMPVDRVDLVAYSNNADPPLPAEWIKVLSDYSGTFIEFSDWADLIS